MSKKWYEEAFDDFYTIIYKNRDLNEAEKEMTSLIDFLNLKREERILDICCGMGRHAKVLRQMGFEVWGVDLSLKLLKIAKCQNLLYGRLVCGEMKSLPFKQIFHLALNLFSSFGYFQDDQHNLIALVEMAKTLKSGGRLVLDHINRDKLQKNLIKEDILHNQGWEIIQKREIRGNRVIKNILLRKNGCIYRNIIEDVRIYHPEEIISMYKKAGFENIAIYGYFDGRPFDENSERMVVIGQKK